MHPSESFPGHPVPQTKTRLCCVPGPPRCPLHLLILLLTKRGGGLGGHLAVSIRKHLLPGSVTSSKLRPILGPPFHKPPRAAVRRRWGRGCRCVQDPDRLTLVREAEGERRKDLLLLCSFWVPLPVSVSGYIGLRIQRVIDAHWEEQ